MKIITALYLILFLAIVGCGPHWNTNATPEKVEAPKADPTKIQISVPNWPVQGYSTDGAILILLVRDPKTFPIPAEFTFTRQDGSTVKMPMVKPDQPPEKGKAK
jgi:hypothetical protein